MSTPADSQQTQAPAIRKTPPKKVTQLDGNSNIVIDLKNRTVEMFLHPTSSASHSSSGPNLPCQLDGNSGSPASDHSSLNVNSPPNTHQYSLVNNNNNSNNDDRDNEDDLLGSDLDDEDDDNEASIETDNIILCQYDKASRTKSKWKCSLKDGLVHVNGQDFAFHRAAGEFEWI